MTPTPRARALLCVILTLVLLAAYLMAPTATPPALAQAPAPGGREALTVASALAAEPAGESAAGGDAPASQGAALQSWTCGGLPEEECLALQALYENAGGASWCNRTNWGTAAAPGTWYGVTVLSGHVIRLQLPWNNLSGVLPVELGNLSALTTLDLQGNALTGNIPSALGGLPALATLNLSFNSLNGGIPAALGGLGTLVELYLSHNQLAGAIPAEMATLAALETLVLKRNSLSGNIPAALGGLSNLYYLDLSENSLTGAIPAELANATRLGWLVLAGNALTGAIPAELAAIAPLTQLDLSANQLTGGLPPALAGHARLTVLNLRDNQLTGGLPAEIGAAALLARLELSNNPLGGALPSSVGNLARLEQLNLANCGLTGSLPASLGNLANLRFLRLGSNSLSGSLPASLGNLTHLETLDLARNQLSGDLPAAMSGMTGLQTLNLSHNAFTGPVAAALGDLGELDSLDLSHNQLSGSLPTIWLGLKDLGVLRLDHNQLSGPLPTELGQLQGVAWLTLGNNQFTGPIPAGLGDVTSLYELDLSANRLTGSIPLQLGSLTNLSSLNLAGNALGGPIPQSITLLSGLTQADLGYNQLTSTDALVRAFLASRDPDWEATQTVPPTDVRVSDVLMDRVTLSWNPIPYVGDGGGYQVLIGAAPGGPYSVHGITANKAADSYLVTGLLPVTSYYLVVRAYTPAHVGQPNALWSAYTPEARATTNLSGTFACGDVTEVPVAECEALVALYDGADGPHWPKRANWKQTIVISAWEGVTVANGHVSVLSLPANGLVGALPAALGDLTGLTQLYLNTNQLTGSLPASLGGLSQLTRLDARDNQLTGALPPELGNLAALQELRLKGNQLSGTIPAALGNLGALRVLDLSANELSGAIPPELGSASQLNTLLLHGNRLTGAIPAALGSLADLASLNLGYNALAGEVPGALANLTGLGSAWWAMVDFGYNRLVASDPAARAFLDAKDPDWAATQTVSPTNLHILAPTTNALTLAWTPISYTAGSGYYQVSYATNPAGPYTVHGATANKTAASYRLSGLEPDTAYHLTVRTATLPQGAQKNELWSEPSAPISGATAAVPSGGPGFLAPAGWRSGYGVAAGGWMSQNLFRRVLADVNGDGLADIVAFGNKATYVSLSNGARFGAPVAWIAGYGVSAGGWTSHDAYPRYLADVNGDGKADIVAFGAKGTYVSLSTGSGFAPAALWLNGFGVFAGGWSSQDLYPRLLGDVNGDGLADIIAFGDKATYVSLSDGARFGAPAVWLNAYGASAGGWTSWDVFPRLIGDVNGDGLADIVAFGNRATYVSLSTGSGFQGPVAWINGYGVQAGGWVSQDIYPRLLGDVNGDGKADIVACGNNATYVSLSTGSGFAPAAIGVRNYGVTAGGWPTYDLFPRVLGDANGDGMADLAGFGNKATYVSLAAW
jgi:Leucine-rich repeat (LRR) protein